MSHNNTTNSNLCHEQYDDLYDTTAAAAAAEAEILEANAAAHPNTTSTQPQTRTQTQTTTAPSGSDETNTSFPAIDIFSSPSHYTLHVSVPGAKAGDVSAEWAAGGKAVVVSGVVGRPPGEGVEVLVKGERWVGRFERVVALPGVAGGKGGLERGVEDGVLVVRVPKGGVVEDDREDW